MLFYSFFHTQKLFDSIYSEPFKIPEDDGKDLTHTFFNPDREGWLLKLGKLTVAAHRNSCVWYLYVLLLLYSLLLLILKQWATPNKTKLASNLLQGHSQILFNSL